MEVIYFEMLELIVSRRQSENTYPVVLNKHMFLNSKFNHELLTLSSSKMFLSLSGSLVKAFKSSLFAPRKLEGRIVNF